MTTAAPEKGSRSTRTADLLALLEQYPHGIDRKEARAKLLWRRTSFNKVLAALDKLGAVKTWQTVHEKRQKTSFVALNRGPAIRPEGYQPTPHVTPIPPGLSRQAAACVRIVPRLATRTARHLAGAAGMSYPMAAEVWAELSAAGVV